MSVNFKSRTWYAVRCCCRPQTLFGFMPLSNDPSQRTKIIDRNGVAHEIKLVSACESIEIETATLIDEELAIYSDDRPLAFWRQFPEFVEVMTFNDAVLQDMAAKALECMLAEWDKLTRYGSPMAKAANESVAFARATLERIRHGRSQ